MIDKREGYTIKPGTTETKMGKHPIKGERDWHRRLWMVLHDLARFRRDTHGVYWAPTPVADQYFAMAAIIDDLQSQGATILDVSAWWIYTDVGQFSAYREAAQ
jgi:hypothetical protein